jgi:hypothetical protein
MNYSRILRVVGQALEPLRPQEYEVVCYGDSYLVRCRVKEEAANKEAEKKIRRLPAFLRLWREEKKPPAPEVTSQETRMNVEFLYSLEDIERLDEQRRAPRRDLNAMPDPYSFSNTLRTVGELLDRKPNARLLLASNHGQEIVILYETGRGVRHMEEHLISTLYEIWVKRYVKKKR